MSKQKVDKYVYMKEQQHMNPKTPTISMMIITIEKVELLVGVDAYSIGLDSLTQEAQSSIAEFTGSTISGCRRSISFVFDIKNYTMTDQQEKLLKLGLCDLQAYEKTIPIRKLVLQGDQVVMNMVQSTLCKFLRDRIASPTQKLLAIKFAKDCIETFNDDFIAQFMDTVLPVVEQVALFRNEVKDINRGKFFFSDQPDAEIASIGNSFFRLTLECIWVWARWFPIDPDKQVVSAYKMCFERLIIKGVTFPKLTYFDFDQVVKQIPDLQIPIKILRQCRTVIKEDLKRIPAGSGLRMLSSRLSTDLRQEILKFEKETVFFAQIFQRALKQIKRQNSQRKSTVKKSMIPLDYIDFDDSQQQITIEEDKPLRLGKPPKLQGSVSPPSRFEDKTLKPSITMEITDIKAQLQQLKSENQMLKQILSESARNFYNEGPRPSLDTGYAQPLKSPKTTYKMSDASFKQPDKILQSRLSSPAHFVQSINIVKSMVQDPKILMRRTSDQVRTQQLIQMSRQSMLRKNSINLRLNF